VKKRQRARLEAKALRDYQRTVGGMPKTRVKDPQTTKELCQDSLGILEEISEHGFNDHRYLQLSNHLMTIHKTASENEQRDADHVPMNYYIDRGQHTLDRTPEPGEIFDRVSPYADMATNDLIQNYIRALATDEGIDVN
jgi:hypothetical protein